MQNENTQLPMQMHSKPEQKSRQSEEILIYGPARQTAGELIRAGKFVTVWTAIGAGGLVLISAKVVTYLFKLTVTGAAVVAAKLDNLTGVMLTKYESAVNDRRLTAARRPGKEAETHDLTLKGIEKSVPGVIVNVDNRGGNIQVNNNF